MTIITYFRLSQCSSFIWIKTFIHEWVSVRILRIITQFMNELKQKKFINCQLNAEIVEIRLKAHEEN